MAGIGSFLKNFGGFVGGLLNVGSNVYNNAQERKTAKYNTDATNKANRELAEYAYSKDLEMWNRQNTYNSPEAQMMRLENAGLNPNLVYGTGAVANNAGQMPKYNAPTAQYNYKPAKIPAELGVFQDFEMRQAQINNVKAQTENIHARTVSESFNKLLKEFGARTAEFDLKQKKIIAPHQAEIVQNQAKSSETEVQSRIQQLQNLTEAQKLQMLEQEYKREQINQTQIDIEKRKAEAISAKYRNEFEEMGIQSGDHLLMRILVRLLTKMGMSPEDLIK